MESFEMPTICIKCRNNLTEKEKEMDLPLCQNCISSLTDNIMEKMKKIGEKKIEEDVDNFSRFILSSGHLFKLDDITIIQCCFNIFMRETVELEDKDMNISEKIFKDAIKLIEREIDNIKEKNDKSEDSNDRFTSMFDEIIQKGMGRGNGAEDSIAKDQDKKEEKKENSKKDDKNEGEENGKSSSKRIRID